MRSNYLFFILLFIASFCFGQNEVYSPGGTSTKVFSSVDDLIAFAMNNSVSLENNQIRLKQAQKERLAALIGTIDVTGNLLSAQLINNTKLGVSLFPAEIFGGEPGTFREVEMGVQYNTSLNNFLDIKLFNLNGYNQLKLAKINIALTDANNQISIKQYQESLVASYFNIINIQKQLENTDQNIATSDSLLTIVQNKYDEGLIKQQDVNTTRINHLRIVESKRQLASMLEQYYLSLKALCDIDDQFELIIADEQNITPSTQPPSILINQLGIKHSLLQENYADQNLKAAKQSFLPTISLQLSNSMNLYNTEFQPVSGNWINSNYIGLRLHVPIPSAQQIANLNNAKFEQTIARNNTLQEKNKAKLDVQTLQFEFDQAQSQIETNQQILTLQKDTYHKNRNLYLEGIVGLEETIQSLNDVILAEYELTSSQVNQALIQANIKINNSLR